MFSNLFILMLETIQVMHHAAANKTVNSRCIIPDHPENGLYEINGLKDLAPGALVETAYINVTCLPGYERVGDDIIYCYQGNWSYETAPTCTETITKLDSAVNQTTEGYVLETMTKLGSTVNQATQGNVSETITKLDSAVNQTTEGYILETMTKLDSAVKETIEGYDSETITKLDSAVNQTTEGYILETMTKLGSTVNQTTQGNVSDTITKLDRAVNQTTEGYVLETMTKLDSTVNQTTQGNVSDTITKLDRAVNQTTEGYVLETMTKLDSTANQTTERYVPAKITELDSDVNLTTGYVSEAITKSDSAITHTTEGSQQCIIPEQLQNGYYKASGYLILEPGTSVESVYLDVNCLPGYKLLGDNVFYCLYGFWSNKTPPRCMRACKVERSVGIDFRCLQSEFTDYSSTRDCDDLELEGTIIQPKCRQPSYYSETELPKMVCVNGSWNYAPKCYSDCGTITPKGVPLVVGGKFVDRGDIPWHAGIYIKSNNKHEQICGGSLISETIVLSAAHCFWYESYKLQQPATNYAVAVGQLYREWDNDVDTSYAQRSDVQEIILSKHFYGSQLSYQNDLAVVVLETPVEYQTYIRPVCLDFRHNFNSEQLQSPNYGKVAGWGLTTGYKGSSAPRLKAVDIPFVNYEDCVRMTSPGFVEFLIGDKICAGFGNGTALCKGDSGGGLAFPVRDNGIQRYYLRGVVSTSPVTPDGTMCNLYSLTSFTEVIQHAKLIEKYMSQTRCSNGQKIPAMKYCDGLVDCGDSSDETSQACAAKTCPSYLYRCAYGACADQGSACNGINECADGSDEAVNTCGVKEEPIITTTPHIPIRRGNCTLPPYPDHGTYTVDGVPDEIVLPGDSFESFDLNVTCNTGYQLKYSLENSRIIYCISGDWNDELPKCMRVCKLEEHHTVDYKCLIASSGYTRDCMQFEPIDTVVFAKCRLGYSYVSDSIPLMRCTKYGWDPLVICNQECGTITPANNSLTDGQAERDEVPWHAVIYSKTTTPYRLICGGSLVRSTIVISASYCFWDKNASRRFPASNYAVALGKQYLGWNNRIERERVQISNVKTIKSNIFFKVTVNVDSMKAVFLVLETPIIYTQHIRPVCLDFNENFENKQLQDGQIGKTAIWNRPYGPSQTLSLVELSYTANEKCRKAAPTGLYREINYADDAVFCAKFINGTLCRRDIGGGLTFPDNRNGVLRYYLRGVLGRAPEDNAECEEYSYTLLNNLKDVSYIIRRYL